MANLFGDLGSGFDNSLTNLVPQTYNLEAWFPPTPGLLTPQQAIALNGAPPSAQVIGNESGGSAAVRSSANPTASLLRSVKKGRGLGDGLTPEQTQAVIDATQGNNPEAQTLAAAQSLPNLTEPQQGIYGGNSVNNALNPIPVEINVDTAGSIFGGGCSALVNQRISQINGFGYAVQPGLYVQTPRAPGTPLRPIIDDNFYIRYGRGEGSLFTARVYQQSGTGPVYGGLPVQNYNNGVWPFIPSGAAYPQTQNLCLYLNNMPARTLYLVRRKQPYYFHLPLSANYAAENLPANIDLQALDKLGGFYFTRDPVGGGPWNAENQFNGQANPPPILPQAPQILYPGGTMQVIVDNTWPDVLFYQSTSGPFMGGFVVVIGSDGRF